MTTQQTALAVIEEALRAAAYTDDFAPDYAHANAPAVLSRVLAALGGEPVAEITYHGPCEPTLTLYDECPRVKYLYAYPAPPIDLAAVRAVAEELDCTGRQRLAERLLRAIGDIK